MRNVWLLFKSDLRHLSGNVITLLIAVGLIAIPSLFSWYNLLACWDVFNNTGHLKVAVANTDEGYQSDLVPLKVEIGNQVVSALRANDQLDWVFCSEDEAIDGVKSGRFYAAVVIPADFSRDMLSFFTDDVEHAKLVYYSNEKKNAIAPKMTDIGAGTVSSQVNTVFEQTLSEIALATSSALMDYADRSDAHGQMAVLAEHMGSLGRQLSHAASALDAYGSVFATAEELVRGSGDLLSQAQDQAATFQGAFDEARSAADKAVAACTAASERLGGALADAAESKAAADEAQEALKTIQDSLQQAQTTLDKLTEAAGKLDDETLNRQLAQAHQALADAEAAAQEASGTIRKKLEGAYGELSSVQGDFQKQLKPALEELMTSFQQAGDSVKRAGAIFDQVQSDISDTGDGVAQKLGALSGKLEAASEGMEGASGDLEALAQRLAAAVASGNVEEIRSIIGSDPAKFAENLAAPIALERIAIDPVSNFGSAMAPLYTTLALWVGALLIMVALKTQPSPETLSALHDPTLRQIFYGRFCIVALISLLQSTLMALGNLLFVGVQAEHPLCYMLCFWVSGLVFAFILYTLVALFANLGKALGVILLVLQISGGGGSYPLALLPPAVQEISPYLPITHAVNAMRAAMFGFYQNDFWMELGQLLLFVVPLALLMVVLIGPLKKIVPKFLARIEKSKMM